jgi:hypothetical protein
MEIEKTDKIGTKLRVTLEVSFDEVLPTGCADIHRNKNCFGTVEIFFDSVLERAYIEYDKDECW